jgi:hypothetical protein
MLRLIYKSGALLLSASALLLSGCPAPPAAEKPAAHDEHAHPSEGPHHGHLIELGNEEYHAELTHDDATKTVTVYLLDGKAEKPVPIAEPDVIVNMVVDGSPMQAKLLANPQEGDPAGQSSRFSISDEKLLETLEAERASGRLNVTIAGKPYTGNIEHHDHDKHEHK